MLNLSRKFEYSLMAIKHMASKQNKANFTAREISDTFKTPFDTTAKVLQSLKSSGILKSSQGIKGGYELATSLDQISLIDLKTSVEGKATSLKCANDKHTCEYSETCNVSSPVTKLNDMAINMFKNITLEELLTKENAL